MTDGPAAPRRRRSDGDGDIESDDEPVLPTTTDDERDIGWGDEPGSGRRDEDWYRRERPPHHE